MEPIRVKEEGSVGCNDHVWTGTAQEYCLPGPPPDLGCPRVRVQCQGGDKVGQGPGPGGHLGHRTYQEVGTSRGQVGQETCQGRLKKILLLYQ